MRKTLDSFMRPTPDAGRFDLRAQDLGPCEDASRSSRLVFWASRLLWAEGRESSPHLEVLVASSAATSVVPAGRSEDRRRRRAWERGVVGWVGVLLFQVLLMLFGLGFWLWSLPAIAMLLWLARRDLAETASGSV